MSRYEPVTLWIDSLAINQTDTPERNQQVSIMRFHSFQIPSVPRN